MSVKSNFFKLNKTDFDKYLNDLKTSNNSIHLLEDKFFFNQTVEISNMVISLFSMYSTLIITSVRFLSKKFSHTIQYAPLNITLVRFISQVFFI